jgi:hypothetical protein
MAAGAGFCTQCGRPQRSTKRVAPPASPKSPVLLIVIVLVGGPLIFGLAAVACYLFFQMLTPTSLPTPVAETPATAAGRSRSEGNAEEPLPSSTSASSSKKSPTEGSGPSDISTKKQIAEEPKRSTLLPLSAKEPVVEKFGPDGIPLKAKVIEEESVRIRAAVGGAVELKGGFRLVLPAGALARDATVSVRRAVVSARDAPVVQGFEYYRIKAAGAGAKLAKPATLRFPVHKDDDPDAIVLAHYRDDGSAEVLRHTVKEAGFVQAQVESFSILVYFGAGLVAIGVGAYEGHASRELIAIAEEVKAGHEKLILNVPFYHQYDYLWCWAASAAMVFGAQGARAQPHQIANMFDATRTQGGCFWPRFASIIGAHSFDFEVIRRKLALPPMPMSMYARGGAYEKSFRGWIIQQIRDGYPVWVGLFRYDGAGDHAVVVVGYDHAGLYVHDPSGSLLAQIEVMRGRAKTKKEAKVSEHGLACHRISYDDWREMLDPGGIPYRPWLTHVGVIRKRVVASRTASLQITPGSCQWSSGLTFHRDGFTYSTLAEAIYYWNGQQTGGCGFSLDCGLADIPENAARMGKGFLSNSDALRLLRVEVHNTGDRAFEGRIRLTLDGETIASQDSALKKVVRVPSRRVREPHVVVEFTDRATLQDPGKDSYTTGVARRDLSLKDALNFTAHPLHLGKHTLAVGLTDAAGTLLDRSIVQFEMHPAVPREVEAFLKPSQVAGGARAEHAIEWKASPEEKRAPAKGKYRVYQTPVDAKLIHQAKCLKTVNAGTYRAVVPAPTGEQVRYSVSYVDATSGYESPLSQPVRVGPPRPDFEIQVRFGNAWRRGPLQASALLVPTEKRKGFVVLSQPYLIVMAVGGHRQFLYPVNAVFPGAKKAWGRSQGVSRFGGMHIRMLQPNPIGGNTLTVTAILGDGTRMTRRVTIPFKPEASPDWADQKLVFAQDKLAKAQALPQTDANKKEYRARRIILAYAEILKWTSGREAARSVLDQANAVMPEVHPRFQKGMRRALQDAQKHSAWLRGDVGQYQSIVTEWEKTDSVDAHTYLELIQMLVVDANNVAAAHSYWPKFKAAAAKMSKSEQNRFHYDEYLKLSLLLPAQPMSPGR